MRAEDLFEHVTADLVSAIEAGASGWQMPWRRLARVGTPRSIDGRPYRGWNALVLGLTAAEQDWCGVFGTYNSWTRHGAQVRRGSHGTRVVLWKPTTPTGSTDDGDQGDGSRPRRGLLARTFTVFAAEQVDGATLPDPQPVVAVDTTATDAYFAAIDARTVVGGDRACYVPATDTIHLPDRHRFDRASDFASTQLHEHAHWTGHRTRLDRDLTGRFGDHAYGAEELVAELTAAFWSAQVGLDQAARDDHARYLGDWVHLLRSDARALVAVAGHAQRALDYLNSTAGHTTAGVATVEVPV
jgi:antirestriction protein ArdC